MPTADEIKPRVIDAFAHKIALSPAAVAALVEAETDDMFADLGMGGQAIDSMSGPLTRIAISYPDGKPVTISAVRKCDTVTECIELTTKRASGKK